MMAKISPKFSEIIEKSISSLIGRARDSRGLSKSDILPRVEASLSKYLLNDDTNASQSDIREFVDSLHADDLCLVIACEKQNDSAWNDLVSKYDSTVKSAAFKFAKNREDAEDLAGSIWAELHGLRTDIAGHAKGKLGYYSGKGSLAGWLRAVTNQLAIDQFRKGRRIVQMEDDREFENIAQDLNENSNPHIATQAGNPESIFAENEAGTDLIDAIQNAISALDDEDRLLIKLYYFDGLKLKDIAASFGYHEATASRKVTRIQTEIRKRVESRLKEQHGWNESEIRSHLAEQAEKLGIGIETMFAVLVIGVLLQETVFVCVQ